MFHFRRQDIINYSRRNLNKTLRETERPNALHVGNWSERVKLSRVKNRAKSRHVYKRYLLLLDYREDLCNYKITKRNSIHLFNKRTILVVARARVCVVCEMKNSTVLYLASCDIPPPYAPRHLFLRCCRKNLRDFWCYKNLLLPFSNISFVFLKPQTNQCRRKWRGDVFSIIVYGRKPTNFLCDKIYRNRILLTVERPSPA